MHTYSTTEKHKLGHNLPATSSHLVKLQGPASASAHRALAFFEYVLFTLVGCDVVGMYIQVVGQEPFSDKFFSECGRQDMHNSETVPLNKDPSILVKK